MKVLAGFMIAGSMLSASAVQAASYVKQPLETLNYVYGHTQEISDSVADGTFENIDTSHQDTKKTINELPDGDARSNLRSLQNVYASLDQLEQ